VNGGAVQTGAVHTGAAPTHVRSGVVYYIDASYFIFRAYHSMPPDMVDGDGNATHALYGFARFLSDLLERVRPERIGVAFDLSLRSETSFRNNIQGQSRRAARRSRTAIRALPRVLPAYGSCRVC
jgi:5'-3' exonuclease